MAEIDWVHGFIKRKILTQRILDNVKAAYAKVSNDIINILMNLGCIWRAFQQLTYFCYDKTNITDDPSAKHVLKRVQKVLS